jgi:hypothetical protein
MKLNNFSAPALYILVRSTITILEPQALQPLARGDSKARVVRSTVCGPEGI